jgi:hypothetical protein
MIVLICITAYACFSYCILIGLICIIICVEILLAARKPVRKHRHPIELSGLLCVLCLFNFSPKPFHVLINVFIYKLTWFVETPQVAQRSCVLLFVCWSGHEPFLPHLIEQINFDHEQLAWVSILAQFRATNLTQSSANTSNTVRYIYTARAQCLQFDLLCCLKKSFPPKTSRHFFSRS